MANDATMLGLLKSPSQTRQDQEAQRSQNSMARSQRQIGGTGLAGMLSRYGADVMDRASQSGAGLLRGITGGIGSAVGGYNSEMGEAINNLGISAEERTAKLGQDAIKNMKSNSPSSIRAAAARLRSLGLLGAAEKLETQAKTLEKEYADTARQKRVDEVDANYKAESSKNQKTSAEASATNAKTAANREEREANKQNADTAYENKQITKKENIFANADLSTSEGMKDAITALYRAGLTDEGQKLRDVQRQINSDKNNNIEIKVHKVEIPIGDFGKTITIEKPYTYNKVTGEYEWILPEDKERGNPYDEINNPKTPVNRSETNVSERFANDLTNLKRGQVIRSPGGQMFIGVDGQTPRIMGALEVEAYNNKNMMGAGAAGGS